MRSPIHSLGKGVLHRRQGLCLGASTGIASNDGAVD
jgi:hypothetical protein